jgi:cytoskeletal protein CcmA (bactofilin family)
MHGTRAVRRVLAVLVVASVLLSGFSGVAAAETRAGGSVTVAEDETVSGLTVASGTVVVRGTVDGDLDGIAGSVVIAPTGTVTGDVTVAAGNLRIEGTVAGSVDTGSGTVTLASGGQVGGDFTVGAETVLIAGRVDGTATVGAESITLAQSGAVGGDLRYDPNGEFRDEGGAVGGSVVTDGSIGIGGFTLPPIPWGLFTGYFLLVNLFLGAIALALAPETTDRIGDAVTDQPLVSVGVGVVSMLAIPALLILLAATVVGIPLMLIGFLLFALLLWLSLVYGQFAAARWALGLANVDNRWLALVVGVLGFGAAGQLPLIGGLVTLSFVLLGLGAVTLVGIRKRRGGSGPDEEVDPSPAAA